MQEYLRKRKLETSFPKTIRELWKRSERDSNRLSIIELHNTNFKRDIYSEFFIFFISWLIWQITIYVWRTYLFDFLTQLQTYISQNMFDFYKIKKKYYLFIKVYVRYIGYKNYF